MLISLLYGGVGALSSPPISARRAYSKGPSSEHRVVVVVVVAVAVAVAVVVVVVVVAPLG